MGFLLISYIEGTRYRLIWSLISKLRSLGIEYIYIVDEHGYNDDEISSEPEFLNYKSMYNLEEIEHTINEGYWLEEVHLFVDGIMYVWEKLVNCSYHMPTRIILHEKNSRFFKISFEWEN